MFYILLGGLKESVFVFKVDFEKAYDSVTWSFLEYLLMRFCFDGRWMAWIKVCVFFWSLSVLVNEFPTKEIRIQKDLKQGDPLDSFLFILVVEGLSASLKRAVFIGVF